MTETEAITLKDVAADVKNARERLIAVETTLSHISRTLEQLSADIRVNTTATVQNTAKTQQQRQDAEDSNADVMRALNKDSFSWTRISVVVGVVFAIATILSNVILRLVGM